MQPALALAGAMHERDVKLDEENKIIESKSSAGASTPTATEPCYLYYYIILMSSVKRTMLRKCRIRRVSQT